MCFIWVKRLAGVDVPVSALCCAAYAISDALGIASEATNAWYAALMSWRDWVLVFPTDALPVWLEDTEPLAEAADACEEKDWSFASAVSAFAFAAWLWACTSEGVVVVSAQEPPRPLERRLPVLQRPELLLQPVPEHEPLLERKLEL